MLGYFIMLEIKAVLKINGVMLKNIGISLKEFLVIKIVIIYIRENNYYNCWNYIGFVKIIESEWRKGKEEGRWGGEREYYRNLFVIIWSFY